MCSNYNFIQKPQNKQENQMFFQKINFSEGQLSSKAKKSNLSHFWTKYFAISCMALQFSEFSA